MTNLEQAYVTHCTFSTSLYYQKSLEQGGDRTYEYTTRAGSFDKKEGLNFYQKFRSVAYYRNYRPSKMSDDDLRQRTHADFPVRFAFLPGLGGHDLLIHACYRGHDTSKSRRAQCFFVHLLYQNRPEPTTARLITVREALALWGSAEWVCEDSDQLEFKLDPHADISDFDKPATADFQNTLQSFLTANSPDQLVDPRQLIPERWKDASLEARQTLVRRILRDYLQTFPKDRASVVVAAEPEFAAFLFYAVARVLPQKGFTEKLSFSTFELTTDSFFPAKLVGTTSDTPETTEFQNRTPGPAVINTFKVSGVVLPPGKERAFEKQLFLYISKQPEKWLMLLDRDLECLDDEAPENPSELELLLPCVKQIRMLRSPRENMTIELPVLETQREREFVVRSIAPYVSRLFQGDRLQMIYHQPSLFEIYITCLESPKGILTKEAANEMVRILVAEDVTSICQRIKLDVEKRLELLTAFVARSKGYGSLSDVLPLDQPIPGGNTPILKELLTRLPYDRVREFLRTTLANTPTIENFFNLASGVATCDRLPERVNAMMEFLTWDGTSSSKTTVIQAIDAPAKRIAELLNACMLRVSREKKTSFIAAASITDDSCLSFGAPVGDILHMIISVSRESSRMLHLICEAVGELLEHKATDYTDFVDRVAIAKSFASLLEKGDDSDRRIRRYCSQLKELKVTVEKLHGHGKGRHNGTRVSIQNEVILAAKKIVGGDRTYDGVSYPLDKADYMLVYRLAEIYKAGIESSAIKIELRRLSSQNSKREGNSSGREKKTVSLKANLIAKARRAGYVLLLGFLGIMLALITVALLLLIYSFVLPADRKPFELIVNWLKHWY